MPERPERPIIIQQSQQQTQEGCCAGTGCGSFVLLVLAFLPFSMLLGAFRGEESWWWIPLGVVLILVEVLVIVAAADHWLGLGMIERINERLARANDEARPRPPDTDEARLGPLYEPEGETDRVPSTPDRAPGTPEEEAVDVHQQQARDTRDRRRDMGSDTAYTVYATFRG